MHVLKIGGNELDDADFLAALARAVAGLREPVVVVHGGGRAISDLQSRLGLEPRQVDGLRVTDSQSLSVTEMALSGQVNKRIVRALLEAGLDALGLSGVDRGLLRCRKLQHPAADLGFVGEIERVRVEVIAELVERGITPVISPISLGLDGEAYNVNADSAAAAIAGALGAERLDLVSNVAGVLQNGEPLPRISLTEIEPLIESGTVDGGMIPKLRAAASAVQSGVARARIVDAAQLATDGGTWIVT